jgi:predicted lipoprotein
MLISLKKTILSLLSIGLVIGCSDSKLNQTQKNGDQEKLLNYYGHEVIVKGYQNFDSLSQELQLAFGEFKTSPDSIQFEALQNSLVESWKSWIKVESFQFGPAETILARQNINTFPVDTSDIENFISTEDYNLGSISYYKAKGFSALDYLLFEDGALANLNDSTNGELRITYIDTLINEIAYQADYLNNKWSDGDNKYLTEFKSKTGTALGSSLGDIVNQFNYDYETMGKWARLGIPLGKPLTSPYPEQIEALYSKNSKPFLLIQMEALQNFFGTNTSDTTSYTLAHYLDDVNAKVGEEKLSSLIQTEFSKTIELINDLPEDYKNGLKDQYDQFNDLYNQIQKMVLLIKSDMPSAMGVSISYQDSDGD